MSRSHDDYESMSPVERSERQARASRVFNAVKAVQMSEIPCACVNHDATNCARIRDGLSTDHPHYERRKCECECHARDEQDED